MNTETVITVVILLLICILFLIAYINGKRIPVAKKQKILERLKEIKVQIDSREVYARRDSLIRLDNLLGKALNIRYNNGGSCGENLKVAKQLFSKKEYQRLWDVHKLRNQVVHDDVDISQGEAEEAYRIYKMGINKILK